ncbi:conserved hypothetical protein [Rhodospirillaceae bacterium LM-1]|nr:conserved hypothetical protein [Rhodospirillaceae bacterium LM-1]
MRAIIRADASPQIGSGHVMRCLALANGLAERGIDCIFATGAATTCSAPALAKSSHSVHLLMNADAELNEMMRLARDAIFVLDHYQRDARLESPLRSTAAAVVVIDDLLDRSHDCDLLINPALDTTVPGPSYCVPDDTKMLSGSRFAMLSPEFRSARLLRVHRRFNHAAPIVHVFLGGGASAQCTALLARSVLLCHDKTFVKAVTGFQREGQGGLEALAAEFPQRIRWRHAVENMAADMALCDLAVGASGHSTWERACLGLPAAYVSIAPGHASFIDAAADKGICENLGPSDDIGSVSFQDRLSRFMSSHAALEIMSARAIEQVDGLGIDRIVSAIQELARKTS